MNTIKEWLSEWKGEIILGVIVLFVAAGLIALVTLAEYDSIKKAYPIYCRATGNTNLTLDEFVVMKNNHLLKPINNE